MYSFEMNEMYKKYIRKLKFVFIFLFKYLPSQSKWKINLNKYNAEGNKISHIWIKTKDWEAVR